MTENLVFSLAGIVVLGIGAQWMAWRVGLPSILLLLVVGFLAGPLTHLLDPDALLGDLLMPMVSLSVGLILFEGGLTLKFRELKAVGRVVRNLVTLGALVTWVTSTVAARWCLGWSWSLSTLLGAILVVTGPTVVMPLLRHIRPARQVGSALKWEGILIDPVGALLALLVFEAIVASEAASVPAHAARGFGMTLVVGTLLGGGAAAVLVVAFRRFWVPDHLQNPVALMLVLTVYTLSNHWQHESGLLTVTLMGIALANQRFVDIRHILEFKENLRVLLISALFVLLAARLRVDDVRALGWAAGASLLLVLVLVVRPVSVALATAGAGWSWKDRLFLAWMAPRGIVAAATASVFALRLEQEGIPRAAELIPATFLVIVGTVALYGLTAAPLARALGLSTPNPQGVLFVGSHALARRLAKALHDEGIPVLLADTNWQNLSAARLEGLPTYYGNVLAEQARDELDLTGLGRLVALTTNHEVNTLATMHLIEFFGRSEVYQVQVHPDLTQKTESEPHGRLLFGKDVFLTGLLDRVAAGAVVRKTTLTKEFTFDDWRARQDSAGVPLFLLTGNGQVRLFTAQRPPLPTAGQTLVALVARSACEGQPDAAASRA